MTAFADSLAAAPDGDPNGRLASDGLHTWDWFNDNALVTSHRLRRDPAKPAGGATGGCYGQINLDAPVTSMAGSVGWRGPTPTAPNQSTSIVFIYSNADVHNGTPPQKTIFQDAVHAVIHNWGVQITTYTDGVASSDIFDYFYPAGTLATDGTPYNCGIEIRGQIMTINAPDGTVQKCASPLFDSYRGPYLIYQCFDTPYPPTYDGSGNVTAGLEPCFYSMAATTAPLSGYVPPWPLPQVLGVELEPR